MGNTAGAPNPGVLELVDTVLRVAGDLTRFGDTLAAGHGQTAARSLIMGALEDSPASIAEIARQRGLRRQSVQETMTRLERDGLVARDTSSNRRSPTFALTSHGLDVRRRLDDAFTHWAGQASHTLAVADITHAITTLQQLASTTTPRGAA